ncbi:MAG: hypothetical protein R3E85_07235 [Planctomycetota bacterium]
MSARGCRIGFVSAGAGDVRSTSDTKPGLLLRLADADGHVGWGGWHRWPPCTASGATGACWARWPAHRDGGRRGRTLAVRRLRR